MIEINLLPKDHRDGAGAFQFGKAGVYAASAAIGIVVVLAAITFYQMNQLSSLKNDIERANQRAEMLREDIRLVDALSDVKDKIHQRISAVEKLDRHRSAWVRILEDVSLDIPEFVWLDQLKEVAIEKPKPQKGAKDAKPDKEETQAAATPAPDIPSERAVEFRGYTFTLNALAATMIKLMRSDYFDEVELIDSRDTVYAGEKAYMFQLAANVHYLSDEELRARVAQTSPEADSTATSHVSMN
ncbi:MAG: PilN domain-containing protein [candidate division Zixibacteria bacterium]|nr:PilN domain-containing protein [candidate division Zixibacteria bacterium]